MKKSGYVNLKYKPKASDLICEFFVQPAAGVSITGAAERIASESSVGTWTEVATAPRYLKKLAARVFAIERKDARGGVCAKVAYPLELFELGNMPCILSSIAGNIFGMRALENLRLEDVHFPLALARSFKGPQFGIVGIRKLLRVANRPLCGTIIKPKLGLKTKQHAAVAYEAWRGGIDIVKDDENLTSQSFNKFYGRVVETLKARDKAEKETGEKKIYMPNVTAETNEMLRRAQAVADSGGEYVMVDILTAGFSSLQTLRDAAQDLKLVLHGHRAMHAALTRNKKHGISMLVLAKICRLIGLDQLHIGTAVGKMEGPAEEILSIEENIEENFLRPKPVGHVLAENWHHVKPVFAVCSGGLHPGLVPALVRLLGKDIIIQAGGGVHGNPLGTRAGATAMRQAIDATLEDKNLWDYAKTHRELLAALKKWGYEHPK